MEKDVAFGRRIIPNFAVLSAAQAVTMGAGLITAIILARALGPEAYGILGFGVALLSYAGLATNFGMDVHAVREISRESSRLEGVSSFVLMARSAIGVIMFAVVCLGIWGIDQSPDVKAVLFIQAFGLLFVALNLDFAYQAMQRMSVIAVRQVAASLSVLLATVLVVKSSSDLFAAAAIPVAANLATGLALLVFFRSEGFRFQSIDGKALQSGREFLRKSAPVALMATMNTVYVNIDIIILEFLRPQNEVGLYVAASRVLAVSVVMCGMLHNAALPALSSVQGEPERESRMARNYARIMLIMGVAVGIYGAICAGPIVETLFGTAFLAASAPLTILMVNAAVVHLTAAHSTPMFAWRQDRILIVVMLFGAVINIGLNIVLIPDYGMNGAAVATLITQSIVGVCFIVMLRRKHAVSSLGMIFKVILAGGLCGIPLYLILPHMEMSAPLVLVSTGLLFGGIYAAVFFGSRIVSWTDISHLWTR